MRVDPLYQLGLTGSLGDLSGRLNTLSAQLSSGLRVSEPGDDPLAASESVRLGASIAANDVYVTAEAGTASRLQVADSALGNAVTQVTSAIALAVKGLDGTLSGSDLQAIGAQLGGIRDEVVSLGNTSYGGEYLFAGTATDTQPFATDNSTTPATTAYSGDTNTQYAQTPSGQRIAVSATGSAIFSASGSDVLASLNALTADFSSGSVSSSAASDLAELRSGLTTLSTQRELLGVSLNTLQATSTYSSTNETDLKAAQSSLVATDMASVASQLSSTETQQQALLSVMSSQTKTDLFDYLQS